MHSQGVFPSLRSTSVCLSGKERHELLQILDSRAAFALLFPGNCIGLLFRIQRICQSIAVIRDQREHTPFITGGNLLTDFSKYAKEFSLHIFIFVADCKFLCEGSDQEADQAQLLIEACPFEEFRICRHLSVQYLGDMIQVPVLVPELVVDGKASGNLRILQERADQVLRDRL